MGFAMPKTFDTLEDLHDTATFGFPLPIFSQTIYGYEKTTFPAKISLGTPWRNPVHLLYGNLLIDIIFYWGVMLGMWRILHHTRTNRASVA